jgi:hypothetical protein
LFALGPVSPLEVGWFTNYNRLSQRQCRMTLPPIDLKRALAFNQYLAQVAYKDRL